MFPGLRRAFTEYLGAPASVNTSNASSAGDASSSDANEEMTSEDDQRTGSGLEEGIAAEHKPAMEEESIEEQRHNIYHTAFLLLQKLPPELVLPILEYAEAWIRQTTFRQQPIVYHEHGSTSDRLRLGSGPTGSGSRVYIATKEIASDGLSGKTPVRKVVFTIDSKDQGWSSYREHHGTFNDSWSWFEATVPPTTSERNGWQPLRRKVANNRHAGKKYETQVVEWSLQSQDPGEREFVEAVHRCHWIELECHARYPGWTNHVNSARIDVYFAAMR